jgi:hypothetical protein
LQDQGLALHHDRDRFGAAGIARDREGGRCQVYSQRVLAVADPKGEPPGTILMPPENCRDDLPQILRLAVRQTSISGSQIDQAASAKI